MEVKPGYKMTEVGVIPEDWDAPELGYILASTQLGGNYRNNERQSDWPLIKMGNLERGKINLEKLEYIDTSRHPSSRDKLTEEDLLFNTRNTLDLVGKVALWRGELPEAYFNSNIMRMVFDTSKIETNIFVNYILNTPRLLAALRSIAIGTTSVAAIYNRDLIKIRLPLPPKGEQKAIASALSDVDALIESLEQLIAKKRNIKQGAMQELFRPKAGWKKAKLGDLGTFSKGNGVRRDQSLSGNLPCVRYGEIYTQHDNVIKEFFSWISPDVAASARRLRQGDILFAASGETKEEIGKCVAFVEDREAYAGGDILILSPRFGEGLFWGYYFNTGYICRQKASRGQGDAVVHITPFSLAEVEVIFPSLEEQRDISAILFDMDAEIASLESKLTKARHLKQAMMQELLTGRIRLV